MNTYLAKFYEKSEDQLRATIYTQFKFAQNSEKLAVLINVDTDSLEGLALEDSKIRDSINELPRCPRTAYMQEFIPRTYAVIELKSEIGTKGINEISDLFQRKGFDKLPFH